MEFFLAGLTILALAFGQNVSFSIVSRSRNRNNLWYHAGAASVLNLVWFITFRELILSDMAWSIMPFYLVGTVLGSLLGVKVSMRIEKWLGATSDDHVVTARCGVGKNTHLNKGWKKHRYGGIVPNKLYAFLATKNLLQNFINNYDPLWGHKNPYEVEDYIAKMGNDSNAIDLGFNWKNEVNFWATVQEDWKKYLKGNNINKKQ